MKIINSKFGLKLQLVQILEKKNYKSENSLQRMPRGKLRTSKYELIKKINIIFN